MLVLRTSRGTVVRGPSASNILAVLESLPRGGHLILDREADEYMQVWLRPEGTYQLEYRAGTPGEHFQTLTVSRAKVGEALVDWSTGGSTWHGNFAWKRFPQRSGGSGSPSIRGPSPG
ncbi:hypothetical protein [Amycolatopsis dongchuanensis]|uniref:Uncharacterized protein n=1 Tax=Amycolatopsis dongchuanensis TaxID=1070866 RepID=A0ABP8VG48_9PSEU